MPLLENKMFGLLVSCFQKFTKLSFHVFRKILTRVQVLQEIIRRTFEMCRRPSFPNVHNSGIFKHLRFVRMVFQKNMVFYGLCLGVLVSPKIKILFLEGMDTSRNAEIIKMRRLRFSRKQIEKL